MFQDFTLKELIGDKGLQELTSTGHVTGDLYVDFSFMLNRLDDYVQKQFKMTGFNEAYQIRNVLAYLKDYGLLGAVLTKAKIVRLGCKGPPHKAYIDMYPVSLYEAMCKIGTTPELAVRWWEPRVEVYSWTKLTGEQAIAVLMNGIKSGEIHTISGVQ